VPTSAERRHLFADPEQEVERAAPAERPRPGLSWTPATVLALQRAGAGNHAIARALVSSGSVRTPTLQRAIKGKDALSLVFRLLQLASLPQVAKLQDVRKAIELAIKSNGDQGQSDIPADLERRLTRLQTQVTTPLGPGVFAGTNDKPSRRALAIIEGTASRTVSLDEAFLVARVNHKHKLDLEIHPRTDRLTVRAAAVNRGYTLFEHVHFEDPKWKAQDEYVLKLNKPRHRYAPEFETSIRAHLKEAGFRTSGAWPDVVVHTTPTHTLQTLKAAVAKWHPGIASDKTQPGEFREDPPHPNVDNPVHNTRHHTHIQAPGCVQVTLLY
jgi:hypothetical protein